MVNQVILAYALSIKVPDFPGSTDEKACYKKAKRTMALMCAPKITPQEIAEKSQQWPQGILSPRVCKLCGTTLAGGFLFYQTAPAMYTYLTEQKGTDKPPFSKNTLNSYFTMARKQGERFPLKFVFDLAAITFADKLQVITQHVMRHQTLYSDISWSEYVLPKERRDLIKQLFDPEFAKSVEQMDPHARGLGLVTGEGDQAFSVGLLNHILGLYNDDED